VRFDSTVRCAARALVRFGKNPACCDVVLSTASVVVDVSTTGHLRRIP